MNAAAIPRRLLQLSIVGSAFATPLPASADTCEPSLTDRAAAFEAVVELTGNDVVKQTARFPANTTVVLIASEEGIDVMLQVSEGGSVSGRADSPVMRTGNQRVVLASGAGTEHAIAIVGKEHHELKGRVRLRAVAFTPEQSNDACLATQRLLAAADSAYATGQRVTHRMDTDPTLHASSSYKLAAERYGSAAQHLAASPSPLLAQSQLAVAAVSYFDIEDWSAASAWAAKAESTFAAIHDDYGRARARAIGAASLTELALQPRTSSSNTASSMGATLQQARSVLADLVRFHTRRGERYDAAFAHYNIGYNHYLEGDFDRAITSYRRAAAIYQQLHERPRQALSLQNIAEIEYERGRFSQAGPLYVKVLSLLSPGDGAENYAMVLNNSALVDWASGRYDAALHEYDQALGLAREIQNPIAEASVLQNIGSVYYSTGDVPFALEFYEEALRLSSVERDPVGRTALLRTIGNILREQGRVGEALKMHEEALALASNPTIKDQVLIQLARDLGALERPAEALQRLSLVLERRVVGDDIAHARALLERSRLRASTGDSSGAEADIRAAMRTFRNFDLPQDLFDGWLTLARLKRRGGATDAAFDALENALGLAEELRLQTANPELRATRLQPLRAAFDLKISMLAERYFAAPASDPRRDEMAMEALATAEQARARALQDFRDLDLSAPEVPRELLQTRQQIYSELAARRYRLETQLDHGQGNEAVVALIRSDIADLRRRLDEIDAQIGAASPLTKGRSAQALTLAVLRELPRDVAVIEYWLSGEAPLAWTVATDRVAMTRLAAVSKLDAASRELLTALRSFGAVPAQTRVLASERLSALVLDPIAAQIQDKRVLLFAMDGALHYVPFAALRVQESGRRLFLIEKHDVAVIPSLRTLVASRTEQPSQQPTRQMLLVADPVYARDDPRLATGTPAVGKPAEIAASRPLFRGGSDTAHFGRLPGTAAEAASIAALLPQGSIDRLEGFTATRDRFLAAHLGSYRFIHVASHAVADTEVPQASALILSTLDDRSRSIEGRVLAADLMSVRLNADAVVLSACGTALGKNVAGEGLLGLQYVVLARGAKSVVSSLWPVVDQSASALMGRFYSAVLRPDSSPLTALGGAMRSMLSTSYNDPSHWAAFMLTISRLP
jgi:CHAT domain-containing protein